MEAKKSNNTLIQTVSRTVLDLLKDNPTLRVADGIYSYEVPWIPGDKLSESEIIRIRHSDSPEIELLAAIGGKYFDAISAAEQGLYYACIKELSDDIADIKQSKVIDALTNIVRVDPPIHYYMEQLCAFRG